MRGVRAVLEYYEHATYHEDAIGRYETRLYEVR